LGEAVLKIITLTPRSRLFSPDGKPNPTAETKKVDEEGRERKKLFLFGVHFRAAVERPET
jgi:hypothetical protein